MVGGKIIDYIVTDNITNFLVKDTKTNDYCTVKAEINKAVQKELKHNSHIWWHNHNVMLQVFGEKDVPFKKIGNSGGAVKSFYEKINKF